MKKRAVATWMVGIALLTAPFLGGCSQESGAPPQTTNTPAGPPTSTNVPTSDIVQSNVAPAAPAFADVNPETVKPVVPDTEVAAGEKTLPPNVWLSPALNDIVKMAQAGVEETVLLSFINNSSSTFNLGSDQIVYLNDLGISTSVINAMIQRDKELGAAASAVAAQPAQPVAESAPAEPVTEQKAAAATEQKPAEQTPPPPPPESAPTTVVNYNYFYNALSPYGTWINVDGYGWCWQPTITVIHAGWRPYCHGGRWFYSNYGWYWQSDYSWGAIVFHYGRWFCHPRWGWCWWPDTVWAPAWVTWRYSDGYCGWAPLPPYVCYRPGFGLVYYNNVVTYNFGFGFSWNWYVFVPWHRFHERHPHRHCIPRDRVRDVYERTVVVNDIRHDGRDRVVNRGIPWERMPPLTRDEIRRVTVREPPGGQERIVRGDRPQRHGDQFVVYRPELPGGRGGRATVAEGARPPAGVTIVEDRFAGPRPDFSGRLVRKQPAQDQERIQERPARPAVVSAVPRNVQGEVMGRRTQMPEHAGGRETGARIAEPPTAASHPTHLATAGRDTGLLSGRPQLMARPETAQSHQANLPEREITMPRHKVTPDDEQARPATPARPADTSARPERTTRPGSITVIGRPTGTTPNQRSSLAPESPQNTEFRRGDAAVAPPVRFGQTLTRQNKDVAPPPARPTFSQNVPDHRPFQAAPSTPSFNRPAAPVQVQPSERVIVRQQPPLAPPPIAHHSSPVTHFSAPSPKISAPPPAHIAPASPPPPPTVSAPSPPSSSAPAAPNSTPSYERGGKVGRGRAER